MLAYETLLDLARQRLDDIARSKGYTRAARHKALALKRDVERELQAFNDGRPMRRLVTLRGDCGLGGGPAWSGDSEPLRPAA